MTTPAGAAVSRARLDDGVVGGHLRDGSTEAAQREYGERRALLRSALPGAGAGSDGFEPRGKVEVKPAWIIDGCRERSGCREQHDQNAQLHLRYGGQPSLRGKTAAALPWLPAVRWYFGQGEVGSSPGESTINATTAPLSKAM